MKRFSFIFLFFALPLFVSSQTVNKCLDCHETIGDKVVELFKHDIHSEKGITCAGCHGGDDRAEEMEQSMSKERGFIGVPKGDDISKTCASCHSSAPKMVKEFNSILPRNQLATLAGSVHGKLSTSGKEHIAQCTTCHSAHGIVSPKHTRSPVHPVNVPNTCAKCHANASFMKAYNSSLPVDQLDKYRTSLHGMKNAQGDSKVAACANCHGSHDIRSAKDAKSKVYASSIPATCGTCHSNARYMKGYGIPTDQLKKFTGSVHGKALLEKHDLSAPACNDCHGNHGAAPPDVESISKVCGTCHALNANLFASSPHKKAFDNRRLPECETCHGNHEIVAATDELLGVSKEAVCSRCHQENRSVKGYAIAKTMRGLIDSLESSEHVADSLVTDA
ncbi:MAG: ammonia-forming cytochrome c nitrite reductase subunit c552, partial [Ignavibacteriae bacterium]|nr:ammonia-forming cytochrome c nitrite reductase subunit c552 [Ignavibacteriota bacterium]